MKIWKPIFIVLGIAPIGFITSMLLFYLHAGNLLGRFPTYNQPDPKALEIYFLYSPWIESTLIVWVISFLAWLAVSIVYIILFRKNVKWHLILCSSIGQMISMAIIFSGIVEWYVD